MSTFKRIELLASRGLVLITIASFLAVEQFACIYFVPNVGTNQVHRRMLRQPDSNDNGELILSNPTVSNGKTAIAMLRVASKKSNDGSSVVSTPISVASSAKNIVADMRSSQSSSIEHDSSQPEALSDQAITNETAKQTIKKEAHDSFPEAIPPPSQDRFIIVHEISSQGAGNHAAGLLAAHLLGIEFNRTVCIHPYNKSFLNAFRHAHPDTAKLCRKLGAHYSPHGIQEVVRLLNYFRESVDECDLRRRMKDPAGKYIHLTANTYPKWPSKIPERFFDKFYRPSNSLTGVLPWKQPPEVVVHLRVPDDAILDKRVGLDDGTLNALGEALKSEDPPPYLVTNGVQLYERFEKRYGWSHPSWSQVAHSATGVKKSWGKIEGKKIPPNELSGLELWADWFSIVRAKTVYHTWSDFSASAVHWNGARGNVIQGHGENGLETGNEPWYGVDMEPLISRKLNGCSA